MELKVNKNTDSLCEGLGLTEEIVDNIIDVAMTWLKGEIRSVGKTIDNLDVCQYFASISQNLYEYTFLTVNMDKLIRRAADEVHEETCESCKARKAEEKEENDHSTEPSIHRISPGIIVISL